MSDKRKPSTPTGEAAGVEFGALARAISEGLFAGGSAGASSAGRLGDVELQATGKVGASSSGVAGAEPSPARRRPRKLPAGLAVKGGRREMKGYTVTEDQLESLGALQLSTAICFSFAASLLTFWVGVKQDIAFSGMANEAARTWWDGLATGALVGAVALALLGGWQYWKGRTTIGKIKRETRHDD